jgi:bifunctional ADP-heptose synthase (sugar kinase/adenylyltransferase)
MGGLIERFIDKTKTYRPKIGVVGDSMIDEYFSVSVDRISPEFPIPVLKSSDGLPVETVPGGAANVCRQLSLLNADPRLVSLMSPQAMDLFHKTVNVWFVMMESDAKLPVKKRFYHGDIPFCRIDVEVDNYGLSEDHLKRTRETLVKWCRSTSQSDVLILSDYNKGFFSTIESRQMWINQGIPTIVDPKSHPLEGWKGCTIFKPNSEEAKVLSQKSHWQGQVEYFLECLERECLSTNTTTKNMR